ncbi:hypothetical protein CCHR01_10834 [Colletotrichum chrysophilum]|uniref:Uncharacterized protein n=1 Tax=Colletotrichum chrysophilum TaxID=1836956 RepID=A0AAD9AE83_9PEZI|nr:hypothetical protein CCHR01_10834 [Colletotrichum chrysophilum]
MAATYSAETGQTMTVQLNDLMFKDDGCHYGAERTLGVRAGRYVVVAAAAVTTNSNDNGEGAARSSCSSKRSGGREQQVSRGANRMKKQNRQRTNGRERKTMALGKCLGNVPAPKLLQMRVELLCEEAFVPWPGRLNSLCPPVLSVRNWEKADEQMRFGPFLATPENKMIGSLRVQVRSCRAEDKKAERKTRRQRRRGEERWIMRCWVTRATHRAQGHGL